MRTSVWVLVQTTALVFPAAGAIAAGSGDYGRAEASAPGTIHRPAPRERTQGTVLDMPAARADRGPDRSERPDTPPRGMTKTRVLARYGQPQHRSAPVGQPPITRWDYPDYRLYFEYDHVLHAVVPEHPEPLAHIDRLETGG